MKKRKPSKGIGNVHVAKGTSVAKREQTNILDRANRWLGFVLLVSRSYELLKSLPWEVIHNHLQL
ncbi:hypothetical protein KTE24_29105 [Burkholderia gladioli]|uniref:hypothetical protein n=1 Tax=Burkholderia gladioli TaxID=28095 RepID=UPI001641F508|nr:hypothetical protein [Burkholderia gladioli]MBU9324753.1 hypothetical protein [Burkholderia gladioli]